MVYRGALFNPEWHHTVNRKTANFIPKRPLVVLLGRYDWANVGYRLMEAINRYTDWNARCIVVNKHPFDFPTDIIADPLRMEEIKILLNSADFYLYISSFYATQPLGMKAKRSTPRGIWHGGSYYRNHVPHFNKDIHKRFHVVFAHRDLEKLDKGIVRLQAPIDTDKYQYVPKDFDNKIIVGHSPSHKGVKNTAIFEEAAHILQKKYGSNIGFRIITGNYDEVMRKKKPLHIFFDQYNAEYDIDGGTHGYGVSLIEAASYGSVCLCGSEYNDTPILTCKNASDIANHVSALMNNRERLETLSNKTREWVEKTHGYEVIAQQFVSEINKFATFPNALDSINTILNEYKTRNRKPFVNGRCRLYDFTSGRPAEGYINIAFIRDIPAMQLKVKGRDYKDIDSRDKAKGFETDFFITLNDEMVDLVKKWIFPFKDVLHRTFQVFTNKKIIKYPLKAKRDEIVYLDNSSVSFDNYDRILGILDKVGQATGMKTIFITRHFHKSIVGIDALYENVKLIPLSKYDFASRYGILVDAIDNRYAAIALPRKFMIYLASGMIPIIHKKFPRCIEYCKNEKVNYIRYTIPSDISLNVDMNYDPERFLIENRYLEMLDIMKEFDDKYEDEFPTL